MTQVFISVNDVDVSKIIWIDSRFALADRLLGRQKYVEEHIKGAIYWDLEQDLSDMTSTAGRHPMPTKEQLTALFQRSGLQLDDQIIVYDDGGSPFAARAWWLLQYAGFNNAFIALEGFEQLKEAGVPVSADETSRTASTIQPEWNDAIYASRDDVEKIVAGEDDAQLIDARAAKRYRGEVEPLDSIAGRIPGALNFDWERLKQNGRFVMDERFRNELEQVIPTNVPATVYCGSGVTASPLYAMLRHYGFQNTRLYMGSYSDWISESNAVVEKGYPSEESK